MWRRVVRCIYIVAYLPHARKVEPQNQPFLSNTRTNNWNAGLRDPFLGYGSVNTLPRRRMTSHSSTGLESCDLSTARYSWRNNRTEFSVRSVRRLYNATHPCGGGFEYLHRDPASGWWRLNGKSKIWDSKICSRFPSDSDPKKTTLSRASSIYKRQTRLLVREGATEKQDRNCQRVINIWSWYPDGARRQDLLIDWPSVAIWLWLFDSG
jgi:hypothetical protein